MNRKKIWYRITIVACLIVVILSVWRYRSLNAKKYETIVEEVKYGKAAVINQLSYKIGKPIREKSKDSDNGYFIYRYTIPFVATNKKENSIVSQKLKIDDLAIISGGRLWQADYYEMKELKINKNLKWELKPGETTSGEARINVYMDKDGPGSFYTEEKLQDYQLYFAEKDSKGGYKYKFID